jgi:hypothetical protein
MRADIVAGAVFPDYELTGHTANFIPMTRPSRRCFGTVEDFDNRFATNHRKRCVAAALGIPGPSTRYFYSSVARPPRACITF